MTRPFNRRRFAAGIVAAGVTRRSFATQPSAGPDQLHLKPNGWMPNNPLPVLIYRSAFSATENDLATQMERVFIENSWPPQWRDGIYPFHHYHSTAHEVLGIATGQVDVILG